MPKLADSCPRFHLRRVVTAPASAALLATTLSLTSGGGGVRAGEHATWHDFNGDGLADLAIGLPDRAVGGHPGAGSVLVLYGSSHGLTSTGSQLLHEGKPVFASLASGDGAQNGEHFGAALASGDFDDDGFADLAIGVPGQDDSEFDTTDGGEIAILWGSANGLGGPVSSFLDFESDDHMGSALVTLNFFDAASQSTTPDAIADLATVGANSQRAFVFAGGNRGFLQDNSHHCLQFVGSGSTKFVLAAGNTDRDPADELYVGQPNEPKGRTPRAGLVTRLDRSGNECSAQPFHQGAFGVTDVAGDHFGASLVVADFIDTPSGPQNVVIGVPGKDVAFGRNVIKNAGMVLVTSGDNANLVTEASLNVAGDPHAGDGFGRSLAAGNFDGDTQLDLAVGIPGATVGGKDNAGAVDILRGEATASGFRFSQDSHQVAGAAAQDDAFGTTLTAANFGNGGKTDLAIGSPEDDEAGALDAGVVNVLYGSANGPGGANDQLWSLASTGVRGNPAANDHLGASLR